MVAPVYPMQRGFFAYISDDTTTYQIATTLENGTINSASPEAAGAHARFRTGWKPRKVYGEFVSSGVVYRTHFPVLDPASALWTANGGTFSKGGQTFTVMGKIGERRTDKGG